MPVDKDYKLYWTQIGICLHAFHFLWEINWCYKTFLWKNYRRPLKKQTPGTVHWIWKAKIQSHSTAFLEHWGRLSQSPWKCLFLYWSHLHFKRNPCAIKHVKSSFKILCKKKCYLVFHMLLKTKVNLGSWFTANFYWEINENLRRVVIMKNPGRLWTFIFASKEEKFHILAVKKQKLFAFHIV